MIRAGGFFGEKSFMWFLSIRQLFSRRQQTILTLVGISLGGAAFIIFSGMLGGFQGYITDRLINSSPHIIISPRDEEITPDTFRDIFFPDSEVKWVTPPSGKTDFNRLTNVPGWYEKLAAEPAVTAYAPRITRQVILRRGKISLPVTLIGVDPSRENKVTSIDENMTHGKLRDLSEGESVIIAGEALVQRLGTRLGATISSVAANGETRPLKIIGTFSSGIPRQDASTAYGSVRTVQSVTGSTGEITSIGVRIRDMNRARELALFWSEYHKDKVESWDQANQSILTVFQSQDIMANSITTIIILVVAFGIYNILNMVVNQKKREIAILRSTGYTSRDIVALFLIQGMILGVLGALVGIILGAGGLTWLSTLEIGREGFRRKMMVSFDWSIFLNSALLNIAASMLASAIPARMAGRFSPIDIIRGSNQ